MLLRTAAVSALLLSLACSQGGEAPPPSSEAAKPSAGPYDEARRLLERGQADAALAALQSAPAGAESQYLQGAAWAKKAETAPLPTPPPAPVPAPRGYVPEPAPEWKPEELQAVSLLEQAIAAEPNHARAHQALADLLAPHAVRRAETTKAAAATPARSRGKRGRPATPPPTAAPEGPDASPDRVIREYRAAIVADPASKVPVEALIAFCDRVDRTSEVESAFEELLKRDREKPEPYIRYGDYLRGRRSFEPAISQYRQALIWKPDDEDTKAKIGDIYISMAEEHLGRQEWAAAEQRLRDAQKWVRDKASPTGVKLAAAQAQLAQIRRPTGR
jgi:tetratricopeptide (TPR) repeat protein